jgi:hypothetical protein
VLLYTPLPSHHLLNVLVQFANKAGIKKKIGMKRLKPLTSGLVGQTGDMFLLCVSRDPSGSCCLLVTKFTEKHGLTHRAFCTPGKELMTDYDS